jgi:hypothetical protein
VNALTLDEAVARAMQEPTLAKALSSLAIWETERVVAQVREYDRTGKSTASHGGGWDTCFELAFRVLLDQWPKDLRPGTYEVKCTRCDCVAITVAVPPGVACPGCTVPTMVTLWSKP